MRTADALVREYLSLRLERIPCVPALSPGEVTLRPVGKGCHWKGCRGKAKPVRDPERGWICSRCKSGWPVRRSIVSVQGGASTRGDAPHEADMFRAARIARILAQLKLWTFRAIVGLAHLERLQHVVHNVPAERRSQSQAIRDFQAALGRASAWERRFVGACASVSAILPDEPLRERSPRRKDEILAATFSKAYPRAIGAPRSSYAVRQELTEARVSIERLLAGKVA